MANDRNRRQEMTAVDLVRHTLSGDAFCLNCMKFTSKGMFDPAGDAAEGDFVYCPECRDLKGAVSVIHAYSASWIHLSFNEDELFCGILALSITLDELDLESIDGNTYEQIQKQFDPRIIAAFEAAYDVTLSVAFEGAKAFNEAFVTDEDIAAVCQGMAAETELVN